MKHLFLCVLVFCSGASFISADSEEFPDYFTREFFEIIESRRQAEQSKINAFEDLIGTYWTREAGARHGPYQPGLELYQIEHTLGYIFLTNNLVLVVSVGYEPLYGEFYTWFPTIQNISSLHSYKITDGKIVFGSNLGTLSLMGTMYLEDTFLMVNYGLLDGFEYKRYRLEERFSILTDFQ